MPSSKHISKEPTTGEIKVTEIHPLYGDDVYRPARWTESVVFRARGFFGSLLHKAEVERTTEVSEKESERFVTFQAHDDGTWDITFDPAVPPEE